jgi:hypothetical protein
MEDSTSSLIEAMNAADRIHQLYSLMEQVPYLLADEREGDAITLFTLLADELEPTIATLRQSLEDAHSGLFTYPTSKPTPIVIQ